MVAELVGSVGFGLGLGPGFRVRVKGPMCPGTRVSED